MKIALLAISWIGLYFVPQYAGDWYDLHFNLYQGLAPLCLIVLASVLMSSGWHRRAMFSVLIIQILLNVFDSIFNIYYLHYNHAAAVLNGIELMLIIDYAIWGIVSAKRSRNDPDTDHSNHLGAQRIRG